MIIMIMIDWALNTFYILKIYVFMIVAIIKRDRRNYK